MPYNHMYYRHRVAPRVGAWIETTRCSARQPSTASLPVWERGLKPHEVGKEVVQFSRSPCGSVD